jgi:predicted nuclease with TOPRIM domain
MDAQILSKELAELEAEFEEGIERLNKVMKRITRLKEILAELEKDSEGSGE